MVYAQTAHKDILFLTKIVLLVLYMLNMILIVIDVYARTVCLWLMEYVEVHVLMLMRYFRYRWDNVFVYLGCIELMEFVRCVMEM